MNCVSHLNFEKIHFTFFYHSLKSKPFVTFATIATKLTYIVSVKFMFILLFYNSYIDLLQWNLDLSFFKGLEKTNDECGKTINPGNHFF